MTTIHLTLTDDLAKKAAEAGLPEPCHRLTEKPDRVPQSCIKHWLKAGVRKGCGRRRRTG